MLSISKHHPSALDITTMKTSDIALALLNARKEKGITQQQLADIVGVSKPTISLMENGKQNITIDLLCRICTALGVELSFQAREKQEQIAELVRIARTI